jgi:hypothetical protein
MKNKSLNKLKIPKPVSAGILMSYKCSSECKHCIYFSSPRCDANWISLKEAEKILTKLSGSILGSRFGDKTIGVNSGIHFTGGEPFFNFDLLLNLTKIAHKLKIPSIFVETNCFWAKDDGSVREKFKALKNAGLLGALISVNPFLLDQIPFEKTLRVVRIGREIFGKNVIVYQQFFYEQFRKLGIKGTLPLQDYLTQYSYYLNLIELLPMGRVCYAMGPLFMKYPAKKFFGTSCIDEITRDWHVHIDNYYNYVPGFCSGISLGDARNMDSILNEIDLKNRPILRALATDIKNLYDFGTAEFNYKEKEEGYISKCHLCFDIRKFIAGQTKEFDELKPKELYHQAESEK